MEEKEKMTYRKLIELMPNAIYDTLTYNKNFKFNISLKSRKIYFIGSGSSYSVAIYGSMLFNQYTDFQTFAITPREFIEIGVSNSTVVIISQGGTNVDIIEATNKAIQRNCTCVAVTADKKSKLAILVGEGNIIKLCLNGEEECFVNSQGTAASFASMLLLLDKINNTDMCKEFDFYRIFQESSKEVIKQQYLSPNNRFYYVLGSGFARPALHECVLKINEAVQEDSFCDEFKNFTHGKHIQQYLKKENRTFILFENMENKELVKIVKQNLQEIFDEVVVFKTSIPFPYSTFSHLFSAIILTCVLCEKKGIPDPCNFLPPECLLKLYKANP